MKCYRVLEIILINNNSNRVMLCYCYRKTNRS